MARVELSFKRRKALLNVKVYEDLDEDASF